MDEFIVKLMLSTLIAGILAVIKVGFDLAFSWLWLLVPFIIIFGGFVILDFD